MAHVTPVAFLDVSPDLRSASWPRRIAALLRLAVLLHRSHETDEMPVLRLRADGDRLALTLDKRWLQARPLLRADLEGEPEDMLGLGMQLKLATD